MCVVVVAGGGGGGGGGVQGKLIPQHTDELMIY